MSVSQCCQEAAVTYLAELSQKTANRLETGAANASEQGYEKVAQRLEQAGNRAEIVFENTIERIAAINTPEETMTPGELIEVLEQSQVTANLIAEQVKNGAQSILSYRESLAVEQGNSARAAQIAAVEERVMAGIEGVAAGVNRGISNTISVLETFPEDNWGPLEHLIP